MAGRAVPDIRALRLGVRLQQLGAFVRLNWHGEVAGLPAGVEAVAHWADEHGVHVRGTISHVALMPEIVKETSCWFHFKVEI